MTEIILDERLAPSVIKLAETPDAFNSGIAKENKVVRDCITGPVRHLNYLEYLAAAWQDHKGIVVSPDLIWHVVLNEIAGHIKANSAKYQSLFSASEGKVEILVPTGDAQLLPLDLIMGQLEALVPTDINVFRPVFSTSTKESKFAMMAVFADAMSPYYNYGMYMCGIRKVRILGTNQDWNQMLAALDNLGDILPDLKKYFTTVGQTVEGIANNAENPTVDYWSKMFSLKKCGSGHQVTVEGWIKSLFITIPRVAYVHNFPTCVSYVAYKNVTTEKNYELVYGLFSSREEDEYLLPEFGYLITETV